MKLVVDIGKKFPDIRGPMSDAFAAELKAIARDSDFHELVLDFSRVTGISSLAMGSIFEVWQEVKSEGKSLQIANPTDKIARLLRMVNLDAIIF